LRFSQVAQRPPIQLPPKIKNQKSKIVDHQSKRFQNWQPFSPTLSDCIRGNLIAECRLLNFEF